MDLGEIEWCGMAWTNLAQDRDRWKAPINAIMKLLESLKTGSLLRRAQLNGVSWLVTLR
jgi:hypothetical protein